MTATSAEVLVAGEYYCDLIFAGLDGIPRLGAEQYAESLAIVPGGTYTMALALTRLGVNARWAASFGNDIFSRCVLDAARQDGIDASAFTVEPMPAPRISAAFSLRGERGFISYASPPIEPPPPGIAALQSPVWLLQTFRFEAGWLEFIAGVKSRGARVFADCRHVTFSLDTPGVRKFLSLVDVFSPNAAEAMALTGSSDLDGAIAILKPLVPILAIKCGSDGARLVGDGTSIVVPAPSVSIVDTVGAGDAFNAGYLFALLHGLSHRAALQAAVLCGTLSTTAPGGRGCPTRDALADFARTCGWQLDGTVMRHH